MATKRCESLISILCQIHDTDEMTSFLDLLFTDREIKELENRLKIMELLMDGTPQREISKKLGVGIATVTRGAQAINRGQFEIIKNYIK